MTIFIAVFLVALAVTGVSTPWTRRMALWLGFLDAPSDRKLHVDPIPLMGGMAILLGWIVAFLLFLTEFSLSRRVIGVVASLIIMSVVGLIDDRRGLPAWAKLGGQCLGAFILAYCDVRVRLAVPEFLNHIISFLWVVAICNAVNFLDNIDGLCAGVTSVAAAFVVLIAAGNEQGLVAALGAAVLGSSLGFLRYNFRPASIFMGDAGSLFLGFLLAILGILLRFPDNVNFVTWMVPVFLLGLPIFDMVLVVISRIRRGVNPFTTAGKDHTSHRLLELGFSEREAVLILYLVAGVFGMLAMFITQADVREGYFIGATSALLGLFAIWRLEWRRPVVVQSEI